MARDLNLPILAPLDDASHQAFEQTDGNRPPRQLSDRTFCWLPMGRDMLSGPRYMWMRVWHVLTCSFV